MVCKVPLGKRLWKQSCFARKSTLLDVQLIWERNYKLNEKIFIAFYGSFFQIIILLLILNLLLLKSVIIQFQTTVSWGISSTICTLLFHKAFERSMSKDSGDDLTILHPEKYFPDKWATSSDTAQYMEFWAPS